MANLSEEERKILEQARQIQDRLEAERLEAGEIDLESENRKRRGEKSKEENNSVCKMKWRWKNADNRN